jgi:fatty acid desaturase
MQPKDYAAIRHQLNFMPSTNSLISHIILDVSLIGVVVFVARLHLYFGAVIAFVLLPILYFRSFALFHDAVHGAVHASATVNRVIGVIYGITAFLPYEAWRRLHLDHHYWSGNLEKDPSLRLINYYLRASPLEKCLYSLCWNYRLPLVALMQQVSFWKTSIAYIFDSANRSADRKRYAVSVMVPLLTYATLLYLLPMQISWLFILPGYLGYMVLIEEINIPHHMQLPMVRGGTRINTKDQYQISRTCVYSKWIAWNITNNFNYHTEHHLYPTLPWYRLPEAHTFLRETLGASFNLDFGNSWVARHRNLHLDSVLKPIVKEPETSQLPMVG